MKSLIMKQSIPKSDVSGVEAVAVINSILGCPCDGRNLENNAVEYIDLLQEAYLHLSQENSSLYADINKLLTICCENNIAIGELKDKYNSF